MKAARYARSSAVAENYVGALRSMLAKDKGHRRDNKDHHLGLDDRQGARRTDPNPDSETSVRYPPTPGCRLRRRRHSPSDQPETMGTR